MFHISLYHHPSHISNKNGYKINNYIFMNSLTFYELFCIPIEYQFIKLLNLQKNYFDIYCKKKKITCFLFLIARWL